MCQARVYLVQDGREQEIMQDVTLLEVVQGGVQVRTLFEAPVFVPGSIARVDLLKHTVTLQPAEKG